MIKEVQSKRHLAVIELICLIAIVFIICIMILGEISRLLSKNQNHYMLQQDEKVVKAAKRYFSAQDRLIPQTTLRIPFSELKEQHFLQEDVVDETGSSCMERSYVRIHVVSAKEVSYLPYFICGSEKEKDAEWVPEPSISVYFSSSSIQKTNLVMNFSGGVTDTGREISLDTYSFSLWVFKTPSMDWEEVYQADTYDFDRNYSYSFSKPLKNFADLSNVTNVKVEVTVQNVLGERVDSVFYFKD